MARVDGGPEALLRLDERRRLLGQPPLGPMLLTADARARRVCRRRWSPSPTPRWRAKPTTAASTTTRRRSARPTIRRHTFNRVPDYPAGGADMVYGQWTGGRISVSSSASDSTALPNVAPATGPAAAIDGDSSTSWVSNALQAAVGQWLQVDFDHPVTNATITITPSATAVGAQVRRIEVSTVNGTSTLRFDEAGKPLTAALPYGETPWVRITAVAHRRRLARRAVRHHRLHRHPVRRERLRPSGQPAPHRAGARAATEFGCRAMGSGLRAARPAGLRREPERHPLRGGDGAVAGGAGEPEPHADGARADGGDADGVGARRGRAPTSPT